MDLSLWGGHAYAIVGTADTVSFIREPGPATDAELRARVGAPADAVVARVAEMTAPPVWLSEWRCMVCGTEREDARISIAHRPIRGLEKMFPDCRANVAYCNDRVFCMTAAHEERPWPPETVLPRPVYPEDELRLTARGQDARNWESADRCGMLGVEILGWLRDQPSTAQAILNSYDEPAQQILDTCRALVGAGLAEVLRRDDR